ncbi:MAG: lysine biosynthesis protein LysX [Nitrososphaeria archaeon]|nr:lysine biosynthesis protein LysX [Nitrososphaeria archaeon]
MELSILYDRLRWEEKILAEEAKKLGVKVGLVDAKAHPLTLVGEDSFTNSIFGDVVLERCMSHIRGLYYAAVLERKKVVINSYNVLSLTTNKLLTTLALDKAGVPTPKTSVAFSLESALELADKMGYPLVIKPIIGSWGKMVACIRDRREAEALFETREMIHEPLQQIYYLQEYVQRPPRDIRAIVVGDEIIASIYRYQPEDDWRTNVARGGAAVLAKLEPGQEDIIIKAAKAVGEGVLGVDAMESERGLLVHEINGCVEFKGAASVSTINIPRKIVEYAIGKVKR